MTNIQKMALVLLSLRLVSSGFVVAVINKQLRLFSAVVSPPLKSFRRILFGISLTLLCGNLVPVIIDLFAFFGDIGRAQPRTIGIAYSLSNAITSVVATVGWYVIYRMAEKTDVINKELKGE